MFGYVNKYRIQNKINLNNKKQREEDIRYLYNVELDKILKSKKYEELEFVKIKLIECSIYVSEDYYFKIKYKFIINNKIFRIKDNISIWSFDDRVRKLSEDDCLKEDIIKSKIEYSIEKNLKFIKDNCIK